MAILVGNSSACITHVVAEAALTSFRRTDLVYLCVLQEPTPAGSSTRGTCSSEHSLVSFRSCFFSIWILGICKLFDNLLWIVQAESPLSQTYIRREYRGSRKFSPEISVKFSRCFVFVDRPRGALFIEQRKFPHLRYVLCTLA